MNPNPVLRLAAIMAGAALFILPAVADPYAQAVVAAEILDGNVGNNQSDPAAALGAPDGGYLSLGGPGAWILLDMGADSPVLDGAGPDLEVREIGSAFGGVDESYRVLVSNSTDTNSFVLVGTGRALSLLDIAPSGLASARYVWIQDLATETLNTPTPGSDIDSLRALHFSGGDSEVPAPTGVRLRMTGQGVWISWNPSTATNLTGYAIRRSLDGVSFGSSPDAVLSADETAWHDVNMPALAGVYYAVSALAGALESVLTVVGVPSAEVAVAGSTVIHLGDDSAPAWEVPEPQAAATFTFTLAAPAGGPEAELTLDVFDVDFGSSPILMNGARVAVVPVQNAESWATRTVRFAAGALQPGINTLTILPRNSGGGSTGNLDDFQVRNLTLRIAGDPSAIALYTATRITRVAADADTVTLRWVVEQTPGLLPVDWQVVSDPIEWTGELTPANGFFRLREAP